MYTFDDNEAKRKVDFFLDRGAYYFLSSGIFLAFFLKGFKEKHSNI